MPTLDDYLDNHPKPKRGAGIKPEHVLQIAVKKWLTVALPPDVVWTAVDHGVWFGSGRGLVMWERLKARGVKKGIPDLHFWWSGRYLAIELKAGAGKLTEDEAAWIKALESNGFAGAVAWSLADVDAALRLHGFPVRASVPVERQVPSAKPKRKAASRPRKEPTSQAGLRAVARARRKGAMI